jgi:hypothetical protein
MVRAAVERLRRMFRGDVNDVVACRAGDIDRR